MKNKGIFLISCIIHAVALILFIFLERKIDVFGILGLVFIPFLISLVICLLGQQRDSKKDPTTHSTHSKNWGLVYSIPNVVYLSVSSYMISKNIDEILASSLKYESEQLNVSTSNSPWLGFFMLLIMTIVLHYAIANIGLKKNKTI